MYSLICIYLPTRKNTSNDNRKRQYNIEANAQA